MITKEVNNYLNQHFSQYEYTKMTPFFNFTTISIFEK